MYFNDRSHAGQILAGQLYERYRYENCAVMAVSEGSVMVAEQIASALHSVLTLLLTEDIEVPGEGISFGAISQEGKLTYNSALTSGQVTGYVQEFHGYLEEQKRQKFQKINRLLGDSGVINLDLLRDRVVILVSDGVDTHSYFDVARDILKPVRVQKLVIAAPTASVSAVDKLHIMADELHILDVKENFISVNHYYDNNELPPREETIEHISNIVLSWQ